MGTNSSNDSKEQLQNGREINKKVEIQPFKVKAMSDYGLGISLSRSPSYFYMDKNGKQKFNPSNMSKTTIDYNTGETQQKKSRDIMPNAKEKYLIDKNPSSEFFGYKAEDEKELEAQAKSKFKQKDKQDELDKNNSEGTSNQRKSPTQQKAVGLQSEQQAKEDVKSTPKQPEVKQAVETAANAAHEQGGTPQQKQETAQAVARAQGKQKAKMSTKKKIGIGAGIAGLAVGSKIAYDYAKYKKWKAKNPLRKNVTFKQWKAKQKKKLHESFNEGYQAALEEFYY